MTNAEAKQLAKNKQLKQLMLNYLEKKQVFVFGRKPNDQLMILNVPGFNAFRLVELTGKKDDDEKYLAKASTELINEVKKQAHKSLVALDVKNTDMVYAMAAAFVENQETDLLASNDQRGVDDILSAMA